MKFLLVHFGAALLWRFRWFRISFLAILAMLISFAGYWSFLHAVDGSSGSSVQSCKKEPDHFSFELWALAVDETNHQSSGAPFAKYANTWDQTTHEFYVSLRGPVQLSCPDVDSSFCYTRADISWLDAAYRKWQELRQKSQTPYKDYARWWRSNSKQGDIKLYCEYCDRLSYKESDIPRLDSTVNAYRQWQTILHKSKTPYADYSCWWHAHRKASNEIAIYGAYDLLFSFDEKRLPELDKEWHFFGGNINDVCSLVEKVRNTPHENHLTNLEALLNIIANGIELIGVCWGIGTILEALLNIIAYGIEPARETEHATKKILNGACGVFVGLATPGIINWLVATARDANLFN